MVYTWFKKSNKIFLLISNIYKLNIINLKNKIQFGILYSILLVFNWDYIKKIKKYNSYINSYKNII